MAYGKKYTFNFKSLVEYTSDEFLINIYKEGYGGSVTEISKVVSNSIKLSREGDLLENIQGTTLAFTIINDSEAQYKEFRDADWGDYKVELIQDTNGTPITKFIGYNQPEVYTEPFYLHGETAVKFTCGLAHLKHVRFEDTVSLQLYTGQKTILEVLRLALNKLPTPVDIREFINIYEDSINSATTDSMIAQIFVDSSVYKENEQVGGDTIERGFFAYDVIEAVLKPFNAHIYHWNGIWYILNPQEYDNATMYWRQFIPRFGSESTVTVDSSGSFTTNARTITGKENPNTATTLVLPMASAELSIEHPYNRVSVEYNFDNLDVSGSDIIKNGCFKILKSASANPNYSEPDFFTFVGSNYTTYQAMAYIGDKNFYQFSPTPQSTNSTIDTGVYMQYSKPGIVTDTSDALQFSFLGRLEAKYLLLSGGNMGNSPQNFVTNNLEITYEVEIQLGTYYLSGDPTNGYSWTTVSSRAKFIKKGFYANGGYVANIRENFEIVQKLPNCPQSAVVDFRIRIYQAYHNWSTYASTNIDYTMTFEHLYQTCFSMVYLPSELPPVEELIVYSKIIEDENLEEIEVIHADGLNSVTLNSFRISNGTITNTWTRRGKADAKGIITILLRQLRDLRGDYVRNISGTLIGEIQIHNTIIDTTDVTTEYWIKNYDWNVEIGEYNVQLEELITSPNTTYINESYKPLNLPNNINPANSFSPATPNNSTIIISSNPPISANQTSLNNF